MLALETIRGTRIAAAAATLDAIVWPAGALPLRFALDEVFVIGGASIAIRGEHAIAVEECGFSGRWLTAGELEHVRAHIEWELPDARPVLAQGFVASVPAKLYLTGQTSGSDGGGRVALLLTNTPYADELQERLA